VAAFLENKQFYGMDEDLLALPVAERYLKLTSNKAKAKAAGKVFGDPEAVEAGVKKTPGLSSSDDDEEEEGTLDDSDNDAVVTSQAKDRWYLGDSKNDDGKHVLTLFYQNKNKSWDYENKPVILSNVEFNEASGAFALSLTLVSNLSAGFKVFSGNWAPQEDNGFSNDDPLACMVSEKLKSLDDGPQDIDVFTTELLLIIDDFNKVVATPIDTPIHSCCSGGCQGGCCEDKTLEKTIDQTTKGSG